MYTTAIITLSKVMTVCSLTVVNTVTRFIVHLNARNRRRKGCTPSPRSAADGPVTRS